MKNQIDIKEIDNSQKKIYLKDLSNNRLMEATIYPADVTLKELKRMIEKKFGYGTNSLNSTSIRMVNKGFHTGTLLENDDKTMAEYDLRNLAVIQFNKLKNVGGQ